MKDYIKFFKQIGILQTIGLLFNFLFYRLKYIDNGYYLVKRRWLWYLFTPLFLPLTLILWAISGILEGALFYFNHINTYPIHWIERENKPMNLREKIVYRRGLWN